MGKKGDLNGPAEENQTIRAMEQRREIRKKRHGGGGFQCRFIRGLLPSPAGSHYTSGKKSEEIRGGPKEQQSIVEGMMMHSER